MSALAPSEYAIKALVDGVDLVAKGMERKWGIGRLRLVVGELWRAKFDAQIDKLNDAIASGLEQNVRTHAEAMVRAWHKLDSEASAAGVKPAPAETWEFVLPQTGQVVVLVRDAADATRVVQEGVPVFSLDEVATLIEGLGDTVLQTKLMWPGARVVKANSKGHTPDDSQFWKEGGDDVPF